MLDAIELEAKQPEASRGKYDRISVLYRELAQRLAALPAPRDRQVAGYLSQYLGHLEQAAVLTHQLAEASATQDPTRTQSIERELSVLSGRHRHTSRQLHHACLGAD